MNLLEELKRRRVVRVALVYAATAFVVLQAADLLADGLALPPWVFAAITVMTVLGFPLALVLAWAFQVTPDGVQRTGDAGGETERWLSRRSLAAVGVALVLVLVGGWFINPAVSSHLARASVQGPGAADLVLSTLVPWDNEDWGPGGARFAVAPDGRTLAVSVRFDNDSVRLALRDLASLQSVALRNTTGASFPFWSPDGRSLGFFAGGNLRVIDLSSRDVRTLCPAPSPRGGSWGANGVILYGPDQTSGLHRTSAAGGACEPVPLRNTTLPAWGRPFFLGDGRHYVFSAPFEAWLGRVGADSLTLLRRRLDYGARAVVAPPDYLLYRANEGGLYVQRIDVRRSRLAGTPQQLFEYVLTPGGNTAVSASANGVMVVQGTDARQHRALHWTDAAGSVVDSVALPSNIWQTRRSRRGDLVALGGWELQVYDRIRNVFTVLLRSPETDPHHFIDPVWSPGDTVIAFRRTRPAGRGAIELLDRRTGVARTLALPSEAADGRLLDWSPDGRLLAFRLPAGGERTRPEVWAWDFDSSEARRLFEDRGEPGWLHFSPDGRWLAYSAYDGELNDVYVRTLDAATAPLRVSRDGGAFPLWSPDGRDILYFGRDALMAVTLRPGQDAVLSSPRVAGPRPQNLADIEMMPDGGFAWHILVREQAGHTLVLNWTKLLEREEQPR
jgi:eukaryotic-like serine/threonine-protein kinase